MTAPTWTIYTAPADLVTPDLVRAFLEQQHQDRLFIESTTLELKRERRGDNVLKAIAGFANASGGIVLVGVDEATPHLDGAPGVPPDSVVAVLSQCQSLLNPAVEPEIISVANGSPDRVVLVIRVSHDPGLCPVVSGGRVFIRQMGKTVPATHDQILDLVSRRGQVSYGTAMSSIGSSFTPQNQGGHDPGGAADLVVRCASALYARTGAGSQTLLGQQERVALCGAIGASVLGLLMKEGLPGGSWENRNVLRFVDDERTSRLYRAHCDATAGPTAHRLAVEVRVNWPQVSFAVDFHARLHDGEIERPPHFGRDELLLSLLCAVEACRDAVMPVIAGWMGQAPARMDDVYCWVQSPRAPSLGAAMRLDDVNRLAHPTGVTPWSPSHWALQVPATDDPADVLGSIRDQARSLYLDLAIDDETTVIDADIDAAMAALRHMR